MVAVSPHVNSSVNLLYFGKAFYQVFNYPAFFHYGQEVIQKKTLSNKIIYIKRVDGGDLILASNAYQKNQNQEWENCEIKSKTYKALSPETNPKRILSKWIKIWKPVDYFNNHEKELTRMFE